MAWAITEAAILATAFAATFLFGIKWGVTVERVRQESRRERS
jgi:hypothetical protein